MTEHGGNFGERSFRKGLQGDDLVGTMASSKLPRTLARFEIPATATIISVVVSCRPQRCKGDRHWCVKTLKT